MSFRLNQLQHDIMVFIGDWIDENKDVVPREKIISKMEEKGVKMYTTRNALYSLIKKGYLRTTGRTNKTYYVKLRGVS